MERECSVCGAVYIKPYYTSRKAFERRKFCSQTCASKQRSKELKGRIPWNKGKKIPATTAENNHNWKGDHVSYSGVHIWVNRHYTKDGECSHCKTKTRTCWANISGEYKREDRSDWIELCYKCHYHFDKKRDYKNKYEHYTLRKNRNSNV